MKSGIVSVAEDGSHVQLNVFRHIFAKIWNETLSTRSTFVVSYIMQGSEGYGLTRSLKKYVEFESTLVSAGYGTVASCIGTWPNVVRVLHLVSDSQMYKQCHCHEFPLQQFFREGAGVRQLIHSEGSNCVYQCNSKNIVYSIVFSF